MTIVPNEAEWQERQRRLHERLARLTEGKSVRFKRRMERVARTEWARAIPTVRVLPKNDHWRKIMVHPNGNLGFPERGSAEWPLDQFTYNRLRDGDVTLDPAHPHQAVRIQEHVAKPLAGGTRPAPRPMQRPRTSAPTPPTSKPAE